MWSRDADTEELIKELVLVMQHFVATNLFAYKQSHPLYYVCIRQEVLHHRTENAIKSVLICLSEKIRLEDLVI